MQNNNQQVAWRSNILLWALIAAAFILLGFVYFDGLVELLKIWDTKEEYSHGYLIPVISIFLIWQQKNKLEQIEFKGSWLGVVFLLVGIFVFLLGELSTLFIMVKGDVTIYRI